MKKLLITTLFLSLTHESFALESLYKPIFSKWLVDNEVENAALVITKNGRQIYAQGHGAYKPTQGFFLASLSKAITGACIAKLVQTGKLTFEKPLSEAMPKFIATHKISNSSLASTTVEHVLRHQSGISRARGNYPLTDVESAAAALKGASGQSSFTYSNGNYAILGELVKEVTGRDHYSYCRGATGVNGRADKEWGELGSYGGWNVSPQSYLAFYEGLSAEKFRYGARAHKFAFGEGQSYGFGTYTQSDKTISHWGSWEKGDYSHGTIVRRLPNGLAYFVAHEPLLREGQRRDLENALRALQ
jgi:CubicO group peptidase (beta-lactamase class C family)